MRESCQTLDNGLLGVVELESFFHSASVILVRSCPWYISRNKKRFSTLNWTRRNVGVLQIGGAITGFFPTFGSSAESGIAISYSNGTFQFAGYQSGQGQAGLGLYGGGALNITFTPGATSVNDVNGTFYGGGFNTPYGGLSVEQGTNGYASFTGSIGPGGIGSIFGSLGYTRVGQPLTFGGANACPNQ